jgi:hypothetical protein
MANRQQVFVAYPAHDVALAKGIMDAVRKANALVLPVIYEPWPFNDIAGNPLVSPIIEKIDESPFVVADITYSSDLLEELDRELTDVFPEAKDLLYHFLDAPKALTKAQLTSILESAEVAADAYDRVTDFLLYYGVLGVQVSDAEYFIYNVNYDLKVLKIRAGRGGDDTRYFVNPAFWPAFGIAG